MSITANRTLLIDAAYLLKRSMDGAKDVYTKAGHIGGLYQFLTTIRKLIKQHKSNKVILFWDSETGGIFRHRIDKNYKANRPNKKWSTIVLTEAEIKKEYLKKESTLRQKKRIQSYAEELYLRQIEVEDIEADDLISYYVQKYHLKEDLILFTNDRDFVQLLKYNLGIVFGNMNDLVITKHNFFAYFDYHYLNSLPIKIICGDKADGIVGVGGIELKTLQTHFPDFKFKPYSVNEIRKYAVLHNQDRVKNKKSPLKALTNISENVNRLKMNFELVNLEKPMLTDKAIEELEQLDLPLNPEGRSSSILLNYMMEDEFLSIYNSNFVNYVEPFYTVITNERDAYKDFEKKNK